MAYQPENPNGWGKIIPFRSRTPVNPPEGDIGFQLRGWASLPDNQIRGVRALFMLSHDLAGVLKRGEAPLYTPGQLLEALGLDTPDRDGKTISQRLCPESSSLSTGRKVKGVISQIEILLEQLPGADKTTTDYANKHQMAENLATIVATQLRREGDICSLIGLVTLRAIEKVPELIPEDVRDFMEMRNTAKVRRLLIRGMNSPLKS